jgi:hypothetical protein
MVSGNINPATNAKGARKCQSWIDSFVDYTSNLESSPLFRKWSAITMIAAVLEQKVWVETGSPLYPNLYTFLVGHAGIGKSRAITAAANIVREALPELSFGATSMTRASLVDFMSEAKRFLPQLPDPPIEYNSLVVIADEFSAFMHEYDSALVAALVEFYDVNPYSEGRRVSQIRIKIPRPQLTILTGSTPSNLIHTLKDYVWDQGLMSRVIMVYAADRPLINVFTEPAKGKPSHLIHDLKMLFKLEGQFSRTKEFEDAMHNWKTLNLAPVPDHPKLHHYSTRRFAHLLKLTMISAVDRGNELQLTVADFNRAFGWLIEVEETMPMIFKVGSVAPDSRVMDEVVHFIKEHPGAVSEHLIVNFIRERVPSYAVKNIMSNLVAARMIKSVGKTKHGIPAYVVP